MPTSPGRLFPKDEFCRVVGGPSDNAKATQLPDTLCLGDVSRFSLLDV